jgi:ribosomal protein S12 methylthiotransferase
MMIGRIIIDTLTNIKVALVSLGCDKNLVDSEVMLALVEDAGGTLTNRQDEADVIIVNTCGFIKDAAQESVDAAFTAAEFKVRGKCRAVVVTGCLAERYKNEIYEEISGVDCIVGANRHGEVVGVIIKALSGAAGVSVYGRDEPCFFGRRILSTKGYAYLKIAEGCGNRCTYCAIPSIRGGYRSREIGSLVDEARVLAEQGVRELILVAQDTSAYMKDICGEPKLHELLRELSNINGIEWIRILYCYPRYITDALIDEITENPKVLKYLDMPVQHAADDVLKMMGRGSMNNKGLMDLIKKLRNKIPEIVLRTTLITGFPGETEQDFETLMGFVRDAEFDRLGVFAYSREEGTPADKLPNHLPERIKRKRRNKALALQQKISAKKLRSWVGKELNVMIEGKDNGIYFGRGYADAPGIDGLVFVHNASNVGLGDIVRVRVTESSEYDLGGVLVT